MKWARHPRTRFLLAFVGIVAVVVSLVVRLSRVSKDRVRPVVVVSTTPSPETLSLPSPSPSAPASPVAAPSSNPSPSPAPTLSGSSPELIIPVAGVRADQLRDTFADARSEGRVHDAIDIPAAQGTSVLAVADGTIVKLFQSERGGITVYELSSDRKFFYYYAHLARYADGLTEGQIVKQGTTIAYVGDSGNAGTGNYHLHFSISIASDPKRWWEGENINPFPLLKR